MRTKSGAFKIEKEGGELAFKFERKGMESAGEMRLKR
jgi:hypothetical protein